MMAAISRMVSSNSPIHAIPGLDTLQFFQNGGQLVPQGLIHPGVALYHHIPAQQPSGDVVLFGKAGEPHSGFNFLSSSGDTRKATVLFLQRLCRSRFFTDMI